ncbi:MAG: choice-of-anchor C family protein, partial [Pseudomonadota bacterium]
PTTISDETPDTTPLTPAAEDPGPPVPQPPVFNVPTLTLNVSEDGSVNVTGFTLSASNNNPITVTITAQSTVTLASTVGLQFITGDGTDDETMTFIGAPQDIENALNGLTYFPTPNNDGDGGLTIELDDGQFVVVADIDVDITPVADDPTANDDNFATVEGVPVNGDVTADNGNGVDFEPDAGDSFTVTELNGIPAAIGVATTLASGAIVTLQSDGTFSFAPSNVAAPGSVVNDSFTYTIEDTTGRTDSATVTIAVTGQTNEPPEVTTNSFGPDLLAGANGGFESGTFGTDFFVVQPGSGNLPNWTVSGGDVDHITTAWVSSEGNRSLDLHGTPSSGGVSTDIATTAGKAYLVTFDLAGNPIAGNTTNNIRVAADGTNQDFSFTEPVGASVSNLGWATEQFLFEATDSSTTLSFTSLDAASEGGPTLDNVRVQEINNVAAANQPTAITGISITDPDIGGLDLVVTLSTSNGTLTVNDGVANGLIASQIVNTAPGTVVLTGTLAALTATLSDANAVSYQANTGFSGLDTITVTASDQGNGGSGPALADTETLSVYVQPPSSIVTDEDFEGGATGWLAVNGTTYPSYVDNKTDATEPAAFTEFLGQFGDSNGNEGIQKTYSLSGTQDSVTIKFDFYEINSWDGNFVIPNEVFNVFIAGGLVISDVHDLTQLGLSRDHAEATASPALLGFPNSLDLTPSNFFSQDQIWSYEFTIETNASSLSLGFGAELDRPFSELEDESFGIDNLTIVENSDTLNGTAGSDVLRDGDGAFDVIQADAGNDIVILEATVDTADTFNPNFTQVDGGTGQDILQLADAGSLDLTAIGPTALSSFETIDLNTTTANTLTINVDDVQGISETTNTSLAAALSGLTGTFSTQHNLLVLGNNADTVNLVDAAGGGWTDTGETVGIGGQNYNVINYTLADGGVEATVAIDSDVTKTGLNTSPTLAATVVGAGTFNENIVNASEQSFVDNAAVSDAEGNFNGGTLVVSGLTIDDHVTVAHQGYGIGQIGYDSGAISYENTDIGVVGVESDQTGSGEDLHITLNASATTQSIEALVEALVYGTGNTAFDPNNTSALTVTLTDAAGASASQMIGINVIAQAEDTLTQPSGVSYFGDDTIVGTSGADVFHGLQGNDLLIGNGGADELRGGIGNDIIAVSDANFELVQGFDGVDTLRLDGGLDLDLTGLSNLRVQSIEAIDLQAASGANTLTLDVYDVFDLSDTVNTDLSNALGSQLPGLNISTTENLVISGGSGDKVNLVAAAADGSWQDTGSTVNVGGENHAVYNYANTAGEVLATVAIETDVTTDTGSGGVIS